MDFTGGELWLRLCKHGTQTPPRSPSPSGRTILARGCRSCPFPRGRNVFRMNARPPRAGAILRQELPSSAAPFSI
eukprot:6363460-Alexandrium_andersonii.AAC.1